MKQYFLLFSFYIQIQIIWNKIKEIVIQKFLAKTIVNIIN